MASGEQGRGDYPGVDTPLLGLLGARGYSEVGWMQSWETRRSCLAPRPCQAEALPTQKPVLCVQCPLFPLLRVMVVACPLPMWEHPYKGHTQVRHLGTRTRR